MAHARRLIALLLAGAAALAGCGDTPAALVLGAADGTVAPVPVEGPALLLLAPRRVVLLPIGQAGARRLWRGEGNIALATEGARVVATAGLARMVMATRFDGTDPLDDPRALVGREAAARRTVDLAGADRNAGAMRFGVVLACTLRGREEAGWILLEEVCTGDGLNFTNRFQADAATGAVRRSEQWAGEGIGQLVIEMQGG